MNQTYVLQFRISDLADGITPAPQFDVGTRAATEGIYVFDVARLGLIDLSFSGPQPAELAAEPSTVGQRYISWFWAKGHTLGSPTPLHAANNVAGAGYVDVETLETLPLAATRFYSRKGYVMPHGTVLRVSDMIPAVGGVPIVLRMAVNIPATPEEDAEFRESFCCSDSIVTLTDV